MLQFKTQKGARRFTQVFVTTSMLLFFSKPIWDIFLEPVYRVYVQYKGQLSIIAIFYRDFFQAVYVLLVNKHKLNLMSKCSAVIKSTVLLSWQVVEWCDRMKYFGVYLIIGKCVKFDINRALKLTKL